MRVIGRMDTLISHYTNLRKPSHPVLSGTPALDENLLHPLHGLSLLFLVLGHMAEILPVDLRFSLLYSGRIEGLSSARNVPFRLISVIGKIFEDVVEKWVLHQDLYGLDGKTVDLGLKCLSPCRGFLRLSFGTCEQI